MSVDYHAAYRTAPFAILNLEDKPLFATRFDTKIGWFEIEYPLPRIPLGQGDQLRSLSMGMGTERDSMNEYSGTEECDFVLFTFSGTHPGLLPRNEVYVVLPVVDRYIGQVADEFEKVAKALREEIQRRDEWRKADED